MALSNAAAQQRISFVVETKNLDRLVQQFKGAELGIKNFAKANKTLQKDLGLSKNQFKNLETDVMAASDALKKQKLQTEAAKKGWDAFFTRFQPGFLSMMFGGMQLQRVMDGLIRSMITNFKELAVATDPTRIALTRLEGSIKFLKFQIVQAAGPLLQQFANWLSQLAITIAKSDPEQLKRIALGIGALWTLGFGLFAVGQFGTFITGMGDLIRAMSGANAAQAVTNSSALASNIGKMAGVGALSLGLSFLFEGISEAQEGKIAEGILGSLGGIATGVGGLLLMKGKTGVGITAIAVGLIFKAISDERGFQNIMEKSRNVLAELAGLTRASVQGINDALNLDRIFFGGESDASFFENYAEGRNNFMRNTETMQEWANSMDEAKFMNEAVKVSYDELGISLMDSSFVAKEYNDITGNMIRETENYILVAPDQVSVLKSITDAYREAAEAAKEYSEAAGLESVAPDGAVNISQPR